MERMKLIQIYTPYKKGGGGALLREKIVASSSKELLIIADESKLVTHLGTFFHYLLKSYLFHGNKPKVKFNL